MPPLRGADPAVGSRQAPGTGLPPPRLLLCQRKKKNPNPVSPAFLLPRHVALLCYRLAPRKDGEEEGEPRCGASRGLHQQGLPPTACIFFLWFWSLFVQIYYVSYRCPPALAIPTPQSTYGVSAEELIEASRHVKIDWVLEQGNVEELAGKLKTGIIVFVCIYLFFARWLLASCSRLDLRPGLRRAKTTGSWLFVGAKRGGWVCKEAVLFSLSRRVLYFFFF